MPTILSFYGDPARKAARIARAKRHVEHDWLVAGFFVHDHSKRTGCSLACDAIDLLGDARAVEACAPEDLFPLVARHDGIPEWLEHLREVVFEGLPADRRPWWHVALAEAIPVGIDLGRSHYHLICIQILDTAAGHCRHSDAYAVAIARARDLHSQAASGQTVDQDAWAAVEEAAWDAIDDVAWVTRRDRAFRGRLGRSHRRPGRWGRRGGCLDRDGRRYYRDP